MTTASFLISLSPFAKFEKTGDGNYAFVIRQVRLEVPRPSPPLLAALCEVAAGGAVQQELMDRLEFGDALRLDFHLHELVEQGWLCHAVGEAGAPLATCVPIQRDHRLTEEYDASARWMLSRFALLRRTGQKMLLESPLARAHVELHTARAVATVAGMARGSTAESGPEPLLVELLARAGFLTRVLEDGTTAEDGDAALEQWEFHDLYFHSRCREGRHANPYAAVNRFPEGAAAVLKPPMSRDGVELYRPDVEALRACDVPFTRVLEDRQSRREHGSPAITVKEVGEFLYRSARVSRMAENGARTWRPYPCGGASYELEIYPVIGNCAGLEPGMYQYCPGEHMLYRISGATGHTEWLLENTGYSIHGQPPQVLFEIAARFQRVSWRYGSIAYATILKDTGVLMQTMYLVAEAMGLAACAVGGGHSDIFTRAAGTEYYRETSVGEFILGRRAI